MTILDCVQYVDGIEPNAYSAEQKARWVRECEGLVWTRGFLLEPLSFSGLTPWAIMMEDLVIPAPWNKIYPRYLQAQIHYANGEYDRYASSMQMFNAAWGELMQWLGGDIDISDKWRNKRFTYSLPVTGETVDVLTIPEGCVLLGVRFVVAEAFTAPVEDEEPVSLTGQLSVDGSNVGRAVDLTSKTQVRIPCVMAERGGSVLRFTSSAEADDGRAFVTGILGVSDDALFYEKAQIRR